LILDIPARISPEGRGGAMKVGVAGLTVKPEDAGVVVPEPFPCVVEDVGIYVTEVVS
jgi:hypothetical protein